MFSNNYHFITGRSYALAGTITSEKFSPSREEIAKRIEFLLSEEVRDAAPDYQPRVQGNAVEVFDRVIFSIGATVYIAARVYDCADAEMSYAFPFVVGEDAPIATRITLAVALVMFAIGFDGEHYDVVFSHLSLADLNGLQEILPREAIVQLFFASN